MKVVLWLRTNDGYIWLCVRCLVPALFILISTPSLAARWSLAPSLQTKETYSNNITFSEPHQADFVTEVNPGIALQADGRRLNAKLRYTLQNIFYAEAPKRNTRFHNLGANASTELIRNFGFLNLGASRSQRAISLSRGLSLDNLNTTNRTDITSVAVNPYIKRRFGGAADATVSYSYEELRYTQGVSAAKIEAFDARLRSGPSFQRMFWSLKYSKKSTQRKDASNYSKESSVARAGYRINKKISALFRAGIERNDLAIPQNRGFRNGSYFAVGVKIIPNSRLKTDFLFGDRLKSASVSWKPTLRTALNISWKKLKVGLNPGKTWRVSAKLGSRRATWRAIYSRDTVSVQGLQSLGATFQQTGLISPTQPRSQDIQPKLSDLPSNTGFQLFDELFRRKAAQLSFQYNTAKSDVNFSVYWQQRALIRIDDSAESWGGSASWRWRFATRTNVMLRFRGLDSNYRVSVGGGHGQFRSTDINFTRRMGRGVKGIVMARRTLQRGLVGGRGYDENRLSISVKWIF